MDPGFDLSPGDRAMAAEMICRLLGETALLSSKTRCLRRRLERPALALAERVLALQNRDLCGAPTPLAHRLRALGFRPPLGHADLVRGAIEVKDELSTNRSGGTANAGAAPLATGWANRSRLIGPAPRPHRPP